MPVIKELGRTRLEANVAVKSLFGPKMFALGVVVLVPVPDNTAKATISVTSGKAKYDATKKAIVSCTMLLSTMAPVLRAACSFLRALDQRHQRQGEVRRDEKSDRESRCGCFLGLPLLACCAAHGAAAAAAAAVELFCWWAQRV